MRVFFKDNDDNSVKVAKYEGKFPNIELPDKSKTCKVRFNRINELGMVPDNQLLSRKMSCKFGNSPNSGGMVPEK
jgi:hypothetical protein